MKTLKIIFIISLSSPILSGQNTSLIIDADTKLPVPYVNIWVKNEPYGTTSDESGKFVLSDNFRSKDITFSAIGYKTISLNFATLKDSIELLPQNLLLNEIVIDANKESVKKIVGKFKKSKINKFLGCGENPKIWARFFPYSESYNNTRYLTKVRVFTMSEIKNAKFNIRIYGVDSLGRPDQYHYNKNIIGFADKGKKMTEVDLSKLNIIMPRTGIFIAIEWFIIDSNKYEYEYKEGKKKIKTFAYAPVVGTINENSNQNSWKFDEGKWGKISADYFGDLKATEKYKYSLLAIELTLSN